MIAAISGVWRGVALGAGLVAASVAVGWAIGLWVSTRRWSP